MDFCQTRTYKNLMAAFAGESQARNRYTFYGEVAGEQGLPLIKKKFDYIASQEQSHAHIFYNHLVEKCNGRNVEFDASYPVDLYQGSTLDNLYAAAKGESFEHHSLYPSFAEIACQEGFQKIADSFWRIASVEALHAQVYLGLAKELKDGTMFRKPYPIDWHCTVCGFVIHGQEAPAKCPNCGHPRGFFQANCF